MKGYDEPEILRSQLSRFCLIGADAGQVSTTCQLLGHALASPILIAPTAMHKLAHSQGESAVARAAAQLNMGMIVSMLSTTALEPLGDLLRGPSGLALFQLYMLKDQGLTEELIHRAEGSGYQGLVITVDAPASGRREADIRNRLALASHVDLPHLNGRRSTPRSPLIQFEAMKTRASHGSAWLGSVNRQNCRSG